MNKQAKIIISIMAFIIIIQSVIIIIITNSNNNNSNEKEQIIENENKEEIRKLVGVYHTYNWNNHEATFVLNEDMTCKYPNSSQECTWKLTDGKLLLTFYGYEIQSDNSDENTTKMLRYNSKEICENALLDYTGIVKEYNLVNPHCERYASEVPREIKIINNGVLISDHVFSKVG